MKILAKVEFNNEFAYVVDEPLDMKFVELENKSLVGFDKTKTFYNVFSYGYYSGDDAFGGREFELDMVDGSKKKIKGKWWDARDTFIENYFKENNIEIGYASVSSKEELMSCFVFFGVRVDKDKFTELYSNYSGRIYDYHQLETSYKAQQREKEAIKFEDYDGDFFEVNCKVVKRENLLRKIKSRNLKAKKLNRMKIWNVIIEPWGEGHFSRMSTCLIKFTDNDVKRIKAGK